MANWLREQFCNLVYFLLISLFNKSLLKKLLFYPVLSVGEASTVGTATGYGLDGPGIEFRRGRDFPHPSRPTLGPAHTPIQWVPGLFPEDKAAGT